MLSASGVVRPVHVEPRYFERPSQVDALYRQPSGLGKIRGKELRSTSHAGTTALFDLVKLRQLVGTLKPSRLELEQHG